MTNSEFLSSILPEMFHSHTETKTNSTNANHLACINFPSTGNKVTYYWVVTLFSKKFQNNSGTFPVQQGVFQVHY